MNTGLPADRIAQATGAARKAAEELGVRVAIAIVDTGGNLAGFLRLPGAFLASSGLAIDKAWTAASVKMNRLPQAA
ncbi:GlcG/HbpS family heme-binding protein [Novosphingobium naphthalenivorans]|uniref:GlcG/HbpS family heme-binding protein n=1 Tax=Novosphingobium naphthalenivorans TaxID=273168 RepID=UPI0009FC99F5|nr:heme-binding protein [Novosphingobium naphthalenivorans]